MKTIISTLCLTVAVLLGSACMSWSDDSFDEYEEQMERQTLTCYDDDFKKSVYSTDGTTLYVNNESIRKGVTKQKGKLVFLYRWWTEPFKAEYYINFENKIVINNVNPAKVDGFKSYKMKYTCED